VSWVIPCLSNDRTTVDHTTGKGNRMTTTSNILAGFERQDHFSERYSVNPRTIARYRRAGLPWIYWGGSVWIGPADAAAAWLHGRVQNKPTIMKRRRA
jgi:hypothetical protein